MIDFKEDNRKCYRCNAKLIHLTEQNKLILYGNEFSQKHYIPSDGDGNQETEFVLCDMCTRSLMVFLKKEKQI